MSKRQILTDTPDGAVLRVHVQPRASRTESAGRYGDALKIRVSTPPIGGAANDELVRYLASALMMPRAAMCIGSGAGSRDKRILIRHMRGHAVMTRLTQKGVLE